MTNIMFFAGPPRTAKSLDPCCFHQGILIGVFVGTEPTCLDSHQNLGIELYAYIYDI